MRRTSKRIAPEMHKFNKNFIWQSFKLFDFFSLSLIPIFLSLHHSHTIFFHPSIFLSRAIIYPPNLYFPFHSHPYPHFELFLYSLLCLPHSSSLHFSIFFLTLPQPPLLLLLLLPQPLTLPLFPTLKTALLLLIFTFLLISLLN